MEWIKTKLLQLVLAKAKDYFFKNYKTTLAGLVAALATQVPALAPFQAEILAGAIFLIGLLAKDGDVSGTTVQPRTPPEVVEIQRRALNSGVSAPSVVIGAGDSMEEEIMKQLREGGG